MSVKISVIVFLFTFVLCAFANFNLTIIHISDFHSHWEEFDENKHDCSKEESTAGKCYGGFARLLTFVRDIRKKEKNVLVLSSGEFFMGKSLCPLHGWRMAQALLPKLKLDAMSLSNHDFDSGLFYLNVFLYAMEFPVLCANMIARNTSFMHSRVNKSVVLDVNGEKVGIVGYIHRHALKKSHSVISLKFVPEIPTLQEEISRLESEGVNKIIALGHAGYFTDLEIAKTVKGVDIVMGGDSDIMLFDPGNDADELSKVGNLHGNYPRVHHQEPESADDPSLVNRTLVLHIPQHGMYVGVLRASFDDNGKIVHESGEPVSLNSSIAQDEDTLDFIEWAKGALAETNEHMRLPDEAEVLGVARGHLDGNRRRCRMQECSLGNFIADALLHEFIFHYRNKSEFKSHREQWGPIDAVVINSGPILRSIEPGHIQIKDIVKSIYLGGFIKRAYMSGQQVIDMMEHSVKHYDPSGVTAPGSFLQISGLKVEYDLSQPPGRRVRSLMIRCRDCDDDNTYHPITYYKTYIIGMPNFLHKGLDGFYDFEDYEQKDLGQFDVELIVEYLRRVYEVIPKLDGRIKFYKSNSQSDSFTPPLLFGEPALEDNRAIIPLENEKAFDDEKGRNNLGSADKTVEIKTQKEHETEPISIEIKPSEQDSHQPFTTKTSIKDFNISEEKSNVNAVNLTEKIPNFKDRDVKEENNTLVTAENVIVNQMKDNEPNAENSLSQGSLSEISLNLFDQSENTVETYDDSSMQDTKTLQNSVRDIDKMGENKENIARHSTENSHPTETEISSVLVGNNETILLNLKMFEFIKDLNLTLENLNSSFEKIAEQFSDTPGRFEVLEKLSHLNKSFDMKSNLEIKNSTVSNIIGKVAEFMKHILEDSFLSGLFKNRTGDTNEKKTISSNGTELAKDQPF